MPDQPRTEASMRAETAPTPKTAKELAAYIDSLTAGEHDYGTCVYAMSLAATAAYSYVASKLGVSGMQAECADLDIIRRTRDIAGPFMLIAADDCLYPQYDSPVVKAAEARAKWAPWLKQEAARLLAEKHSPHVPYGISPQVVAHWKKLAKAKS